MHDDFWESAAQADPLWAILSDPTKRGRQWDVKAFFETGRREISTLLYDLRRRGCFPNTHRALDFGCGVGRLTQALAATFDEVVGVDVSPTMIRLANELNRFPQNARYVLNQSETLGQFRSDEYDFIYSDIVLQHLEPRLAEGYIIEFVRLLAHGGIAVFQLPSHRRSPTGSETTAPVAMSMQAYRANLRIVQQLPSSLRPGETATAIIEVENSSPERWDQNAVGLIQLGNHWRNADGHMVIEDDGRAALPWIVEPGATVRLAVQVKAPDEPGPCECEFDVVHEAIAWFGDLGSPTVRATVAVTPSSAAGSRDGDRPLAPASIVADASRPTGPVATAPSKDLGFPDLYSLLPPANGREVGNFAMHGIPREQVIETLQKHGASAFFIEDDEQAGHEWQGYRYFVRKP